LKRSRREVLDALTGGGGRINLTEEIGE
jgi:hypothetical protein